MTLGFAETMPENDNVVYHVEWLENQQVFPSLSSTTNGGGHDASQDEWEFLHRQEILQAQEDFSTDGGHHQLKTCEMEDTWQQVDVLREKQFVDVAAEATNLPQRSKVAPTKPQRHHTPPLTEEQRRHFYWEMIDRLDEQEAINGGGDFYDLYYDRKTHSNHKNNSKHSRRHHMELLQRWHHRLEVGDVWSNGKNLQLVMDHVQQQQSVSQEDCLSLEKAAWGRPPAINPRLVHSLVMPRHHHYADRSSSGFGQGSKVFKSLMEPDFCLQVKNG